MTYPNFNSRFEKIRYTVVMVSFPSIAIIAIVSMFMINTNFDSDFERTEMIVIGINNTYMGIENTMIRNCEQDARLDYLTGLSLGEVEKNMRECLVNIPYSDRSSDEIKITIKDGELEI